jgi:AbrB family looped-hinge helix DNA binding protein
MMACGADQELSIMAETTFDVRVAANGRMVLPAAVRNALGIRGESRVTLTLEKDQVAIRGMAERVRRAQELYQAHAKKDLSVDNFLKSRKAEQARRDARLASPEQD